MPLLPAAKLKPVISYVLIAGVAELADAPDSK